LTKKTKWVKLAEMDFITGRRELDEMEERDAETYKADTKFQKVMGILF
jgi:amino acid transporter